MPGGNGTGPAGAGPMTGRAAGFCAGNGVPGYANPAAGRFGGGFSGRGCGGRGGFGRGCRNLFFATGQPGWARFGGTASGADEKLILAGQAELLQKQLDGIRTRLGQLENKPEAEG